LNKQLKKYEAGSTNAVNILKRINTLENTKN